MAKPSHIDFYDSNTPAARARFHFHHSTSRRYNSNAGMAIACSLESRDMGIVWGLVAALGWGIADFLTTQVARRAGVAHAIFYFESVGLFATIALLLIWPDLPAPHAGAWALIVATSLLNLLGMALLFRAFTIGTLALVAPIASGFAVITALLSLLSGERPALLPLLGAALLVGGVIVVSYSRPSDGSVTLAGVPAALASVVVFGVFFWSLGYVTPALGALWPVLVLRAMKSGTVLLFFLWRGGLPTRLTRPTFALVLGAATCGTLGFTAYNLGTATSFTTIVTAIASLSSAVTMLLARAILGDHLSHGQWAGVGIILLGVLLVSL